MPISNNSLGFPVFHHKTAGKPCVTYINFTRTGPTRPSLTHQGTYIHKPQLKPKSLPVNFTSFDLFQHHKNRFRCGANIHPVFHTVWSHVASHWLTPVVGPRLLARQSSSHEDHRGAFHHLPTAPDLSCVAERLQPMPHIKYQWRGAVHIIFLTRITTEYIYIYWIYMDIHYISLSYHYHCAYEVWLYLVKICNLKIANSLINRY